MQTSTDTAAASAAPEAEARPRKGKGKKGRKKGAMKGLPWSEAGEAHGRMLWF